MNILIIGSGGREHALAWKAAQSSQVNKVFVAPGNGGTALENKVENVAIDVLDFAKLIAFAKNNSIQLTIVGPEQPLAAGIVDAFQQQGLTCFGPNQNSAKLEASKQFSKEFMMQHNIPTATFANFTESASAKNYVEQHFQKQPNTPIVIKADGLAAGKGVVIAADQQQAFTAIDEMLIDNRFGEAGQTIIIEEFLQGEEASFIVISDGTHTVPLVASQDHKARDDGDKGPNTGGMGAYSPTPIITPSLQQRVLAEIIEPTIQGMRQAGTPYVGFLYAGLMITPSGNPKLLEYNCRLGDPEAEIILLRLKSDLVELCLQALDHNLQHYQLDWDVRSAIGVILASEGYPGSYEKGLTITGLHNNDDDNDKNNIKVFHSGTRLKNNEIITNGGRVLCVCALADSIQQAQSDLYNQIKTIQWPGVFYRHDIGYRAVS